MLFIPIDVLNKKFSLLKHLALIMLHDYLHCLVFKEQSCLALLSKYLSLQATHLSYRIQISLSRTFLISFFKFFEPSHCLASHGFLHRFASVSVSDLYYDTRVLITCQHLFSFLFHIFFHKVLLTGRYHYFFVEILWQRCITSEVFLLCVLHQYNSD